MSASGPMPRASAWIATFAPDSSSTRRRTASSSLSSATSRAWRRAASTVMETSRRRATWKCHAADAVNHVLEPQRLTPRARGDTLAFRAETPFPEPAVVRSTTDPASPSDPRPATLGELRASGWRPRTVKQELRANLVARLAAGTPIFPGIVGYDETVIPLDRERDPRGPGHRLPRRARPGEDAPRPAARRTPRRVAPGRARRRAQRRPVRADQRRREGDRGRAGRRDARSTGSRATAATRRSSPRPTSRSPTSSARSTRSASPRAATSPTS